MDSEKDIEKRLFDEVKKLGGVALKFSSQTQTGFPDRMILLPGGKIFWVELKSEGKKPRPIQKIRLQQLRELGFDSRVIDTFKKLDELLNEIKVWIQNL